MNTHDASGKTAIQRLAELNPLKETERVSAISEFLADTKLHSMRPKNRSALLPLALMGALPFAGYSIDSYLKGKE
jgi:hypothetical protein